MLKNTPKNSYESLPVSSKLIFLAGIFDGEGSFGIWSKGIGRKKEFACTIEMTDQDTLQNAADNCDFIFNLAALIGIPYSYIAPRSYIETNLNGLINLMNIVKKKIMLV